MNILLDHLDFDMEYGYEYFKNIIKTEMKVTIIPFSFHEDWITDSTAWEKSYNRMSGKYYEELVKPFKSYGIDEGNIQLINYYVDDEKSAIEKIKNSNILLFTGGFPEKIMKRLNEIKLTSTIETYQGIIMGFSAGAMIQCENYYISPDEDYTEFTYEKGLKGINNFAVQVHFKCKKEEIDSIEKYMNEIVNKVYTTTGESAILVDNGKVTLLGNAKLYQK